MSFRNSGPVCGCSLDFFPSNSGNSGQFWLKRPWWPWQLLYPWTLRDINTALMGHPSPTLPFQVEARNSVGCVAFYVKWNSFSFSIVPTSSFCCRQRTFWRYCNYNVFERASTLYLFLLSPKTGISTFTSIRNLRNGLPCEVLVSNTILVIGLSRWRSSITSDRLVHIST